MPLTNPLLDHPTLADLMAPKADFGALAAPLRTAGVRAIECVAADFGSQARGKVLARERFLAERSARLPSVVFGTTLSGGEPAAVFEQLIPPTYPDVELRPDLATLVPQPFAERQLSVICDVHGRVPSPRGDGAEVDLAGLAPRTLLQRALALLAAQGWQARVAPELEFFLFAPWPGHGPLRAAASPTAAAAQEPANELYGAERASLFSRYFDALWQACEAQRIPITGYAHEAARSQYEVNFAPGEPLAQADAVWRFKRLARELALRLGFVASFMAKPEPDDVGTGLHWHASLLRADGRNLFSAADGGAAPALLHALGGLQALAPAGLALLAPHANAYLRLSRADAAPASADWGWDNRSAAFRIPACGPDNRRVELRLPGGDANPYLTLAWLLGALHQGLTQRLQPSPPLTGAARTDSAQALPRSLDAALAHLDALPGAIFDDAFKTAFHAIKHHELAERAACADPHRDWDLALLLHGA